MLRTLLVVLHASAGVSGLLLGVAAFAPRPGRPGAVRIAYLTCIGLLMLSMFALIATDWRELAAGARIAFSALAALAVVMAYRLVRAVAEAAAMPDGWQRRYINHVFFGYISLWIGFLVVPALNLPYPQVVIPVVALGTLALGRFLVARYQKRVLATGDVPAGPPRA